MERLKMLILRMFWALFIVLSASYAAEVLPYPDYSNTVYIEPIVEYPYFNSQGFDEKEAIHYRTLYKTEEPGPYAKNGLSPVYRPMGSQVGKDGKGDLNSKSYDYVTVFNDLDVKAKTLWMGNTVFGFHNNGNRWDLDLRGPGGFIRTHGVMDGTTRNHWMMRDAAGNMTKFDTFFMFCNSRYNTAFRTYKRRQSDCSMIRINELWNRHPRLFSHVDGDSETEQPGQDFNPLTQLEFEDWKNNSGIYNPKSLTVSLWYHNGQTGVANVVYDPKGAKTPLRRGTGCEFRGWPDTGDAAKPGYGLLIVNVSALGGGDPERFENGVVRYQVVGGADNGSNFNAKIEYFGNQGRNGGSGDIKHFMTAMNDHMIEDYIKWQHLKLFELRKGRTGQSDSVLHADIRSRLYSHEVGVIRNHVTYDFYDNHKSMTSETRWGSAGVTKYGGISAALCTQNRDNSRDGYKNWGQFEWNASPKKSDYAADKKDLNIHLQYGAHVITPNGWQTPGYNVDGDEGYEKACREILQYRQWKPWISGGNNAEGGHVVSYLPPKVHGLEMAARAKGTLLMWNEVIWPDLGYRWTSWPDFVEFIIYDKGVQVAATAKCYHHLAGGTGPFTVCARSKAGNGAVSAAAAPANSARRQPGSFWSKPNLNTAFKASYGPLGKENAFSNCLMTDAKSPSGIGIAMKDQSDYCFGDYQGIRFVPPQGFSLSSVKFDYQANLNTNVYLELWESDGKGNENMLFSVNGNSSQTGKSALIADTRNAWFEFRVTVGVRGESEVRTPVRNVNGSGLFALIRNLSVGYRTEGTYGKEALVSLTHADGRL